MYQMEGHSYWEVSFLNNIGSLWQLNIELFSAMLVIQSANKVDTHSSLERLYKQTKNICQVLYGSCADPTRELGAEPDLLEE